MARVEATPGSTMLDADSMSEGDSAITVLTPTCSRALRSERRFPWPVKTRVVLEITGY
jgi:hypothetical protein